MNDFTAYLGCFSLLAICTMCVYSILFFDNRDYKRLIRIPRIYPAGTVVRIKSLPRYPRAIVLSNGMPYDLVFITLVLILDDETGFGFKYAVPSEEVTYWGETEADIAKWREKNIEINDWRCNPFREWFLEEDLYV